MGALAKQQYEDFSLDDLVDQETVEESPETRAKLPSNVVDFLKSMHSRKSLERRKNGKRNLGSSSGELAQVLDLPSIEERIRRLANYCFSDSAYTLNVNDYHIQTKGNNSSGLSIDVKLNEMHAKGRVEFSFGFKFDDRLTNTAIFIQELARYIGTDNGITAGELVKLAYWKTPYIREKRDGMYKVSFEFEKGKTTIAFKTADTNQFPTRREYLDPEQFKFTLAKYAPDDSYIVFERYPGKKPAKIEGEVPEFIKGPDGIYDNLFETPGCLEHYVNISEYCIIN